MKRIMFVLFVLIAFAAGYSQDGLRQRSMMKNTIFYVQPDGKVLSADYWQLQLGSFEVTVNRRYPGEGVVPIDGTVSVALMSGGYLEGNGAGSKGKAMVRLVTSAELAVKRNGNFEFIRPDTIDFIYYGGERVKLKGASESEDLYVYIEERDNTYKAKRFVLAAYVSDKNTGELTYTGQISPLIGVSFTQEGARRAHRAAMDAN